MPVQIRSSLFGVHLEELMGYDGEKGGVPRVVKDCARYLRQTGTLLFIRGTSLSDHFCQALPARDYSDVPQTPLLYDK